MRLPLSVLPAVLLAGCAEATMPDTEFDVTTAYLSRQGVKPYLVLFDPQTAPDAVIAAVEAAGGVVDRVIEPIGVVTAFADDGFAAKVSASQAIDGVSVQSLMLVPEPNAHEDIEGSIVEQPHWSRPTPSDAYYYYQWDLRRIGAPEAWGRVNPTALVQTTVAVIDAGIMDDHPDLAGRVVRSIATNFCRESGGPNDAAGYPRYSRYIDFDNFDPANPCPESSVVLYHPHGTHVAGTVGAQLGGGKVVGVAPGVSLASYKVFDRLRFTVDERTIDTLGASSGAVLAAIVDAADDGHRVINLSLGGLAENGSEDHVAWQRAIDYATARGAVVVAAAGNAAWDLDAPDTWFDGSEPFVLVPAMLDDVVTVSATGTHQLVDIYFELFAPPFTDRLAFYSNWGSTIDLGAPGGDCALDAEGTSWCLRPPAERPAGAGLGRILSTIITPFEGHPSYGWYMGTSMAAPHVAGVAALVAAQHPDWTSAQIRERLLETAQQVDTSTYGWPPRDSTWLGKGIVDANRATEQWGPPRR